MMAKVKEKYVRTKPHCNIGTIGHVDHGKTTLTAAITKVLFKGETGTKFLKYDQIDRQVEERSRGITIIATHVEYETEARHYTHIDCPGHQDYIKNMIIGATQMEGVILVVAVTEGPQEQTREHVILAKEVGIKYLVVFCNKLDALLERDMKEFVEIEIRELLVNYDYPEDLPMVFGSARRALEEEDETDIGTGSVRELMNIVDSYIQVPSRLTEDPFLLSIEEIFVITGRGTVVTGKVERGEVKVGNPLEIVGSKIFQTSCAGLEMYRRSMDYAQVGDNVGILVRGIKKDDIRRGFVVAQPGTVKAVAKFEAKAYLLTKKEGGRHKPILSKFKPQFFFRTANVTGSIILPEGVTALPGDTVSFEVHLLDKAAITEGLRFVMREGSVTLGAGFVVKLLN